MYVFIWKSILYANPPSGAHMPAHFVVWHLIYALCKPTCKPNYGPRIAHVNPLYIISFLLLLSRSAHSAGPECWPAGTFLCWKLFCSRWLLLASFRCCSFVFPLVLSFHLLPPPSTSFSFYLVVLSSAFLYSLFCLPSPSKFYVTNICVFGGFRYFPFCSVLSFVFCSFPSILFPVPFFIHKENMFYKYSQGRNLEYCAAWRFLYKKACSRNAFWDVN